jgi:hypothetical protein
MAEAGPLDPEDEAIYLFAAPSTNQIKPSRSHINHINIAIILHLKFLRPLQLISWGAYYNLCFDIFTINNMVIFECVSLSIGLFGIFFVQHKMACLCCLCFCIF